ncbi:MAG: sulfite exporter TauE/SafE family protein [Hyphomonadaceae bacterium]|nr:sulfite exporter TauE/SafE family protein [Hyphomonadaceae bacterium]
MTPDLLLFVAALAGAGLFAGFIGGLFGVGGGVVLVPALYAVLGALGYGEGVRTHVAVATSLSTIIATSWRSLAAHRKAGAVDGEILKTWSPWIALGALAGALVAGAVDGRALLSVFGVGLLLVAANMGFARESWRVASSMPTGLARAGAGGAIGTLSAMMGIGGGAFGVTVMTLCGRPIHQAVATASGFGAAIAVPAALVNVWTGWGEAGLPPWSAGYVNLPGFAILAVLTALTAPVGARFAHSLPRQRLKQAFAAFLALMAVALLREAWS